MILGAILLIVPLIVTISENFIRIFVPMIGMILLLFGFPIIINNRKSKDESELT